MTEQRVALLTGGNKGIGLEIARQLAQVGVHVVIGTRDDGRARVAVEDLARQQRGVDRVRIDHDDLSTLAPAANEIRSRHDGSTFSSTMWGVFDFGYATPSEASINAVRRVMGINFIGALAVTQAVLPLLKQSPPRVSRTSPARSVRWLSTVDPEFQRYSQRFIGYNALKAALNMLTIQLSEELKGTGVVVNSVSPGFVKTDLTAMAT